MYHELRKRGTRTGVSRILAALAILVALTATADAQSYPTRLIKLMHGFPPGGNVDVVARLMAQEMSKSLGQAIVVEGKPGQAGSLAPVCGHGLTQNHCAGPSDYGLMLARKRPIRSRI